jgi:hypothetical protein
MRVPWIVRISLSGTGVFNGEEKMVTKIGSVATVVACGLLSGCADVLSDKMSTFGPDPVIESESFQRIDLAPLLYPEGKKHLWKLATLLLNKRHWRRRFRSSTRSRTMVRLSLLKKIDSRVNFILGSLSYCAHSAINRVLVDRDLVDSY